MSGETFINKIVLQGTSPRVKFQGGNNFTNVLRSAKFKGSALINQINHMTVPKSGDISSSGSLIITCIAIETTR